MGAPGMTWLFLGAIFAALGIFTIVEAVNAPSDDDQNNLDHTND